MALLALAILYFPCWLWLLLLGIILIAAIVDCGCLKTIRS